MRVRADAARAIAQLPGQDSILMLRVKAQAGDPEPAVIGQCFLSLLGMEARTGIPFVARFLNAAKEDIRFEAAAALGECPDLLAVETLIARWRVGKECRNEARDRVVAGRIALAGSEGVSRSLVYRNGLIAINIGDVDATRGGGDFLGFALGARIDRPLRGTVLTLRRLGPHVQFLPIDGVHLRAGGRSSFRPSRRSSSFRQLRGSTLSRWRLSRSPSRRQLSTHRRR